MQDTHSTQRKREEINIVAALSGLGHGLGEACTREEAAKIIAQAVDDLLGWDACSLDFYSPEQNSIYPVMAVDVIEGRRVDVSPVYEAAAPGPLARRVIDEGGQLILREGAADAGTGLVPFGDTKRRSSIKSGRSSSWSIRPSTPCGGSRRS